MNMFKNLTKAALAALATPVGLGWDLISAPACTINTDRGIFGNTKALAEQARKAWDAAVEPEKEHG